VINVFQILIQMEEQDADVILAKLKTTIAVLKNNINVQAKI